MKYPKLLSGMLLVSVLFSCEKKIENYDWKRIAVLDRTSLTSIYMVNEIVGYVGGYSHIGISKTITHMSQIPSASGDTLIFAADNGLFYHKYAFEKAENEGYYIKRKMLSASDTDFYLFSRTRKKIEKSILGDSTRYVMSSEATSGIADMAFPSKNAGYAISTEPEILKFEQ